MLTPPCPATHPALECWRWLALKIACALEPEEPRLLDRYQDAGRQLLDMGLLQERELAQQEFALLYRCAREALLPWHWRCLCMDRLARPLQVLERLARDDASLEAPLRLLRMRLVHTEMGPSVAPPPL